MTVNDEETGMSSDEWIEVLALTDLRPRELSEPLAAMNQSENVLSFAEDGPAEKFVKALYEGSRRMREARVDAVVLYNGTGILGFVSLVLSRLYDVPLIIRMNGDLFRQHREKRKEFLGKKEYWRLLVFSVYSLITKLVFWAADGYVTVSEALERIVAGSSEYPDRETGAAYNPVDTGTYANGGQLTNVQGVNLRGKEVVVTVTNLHYEGKYRGIAELLGPMSEVLSERDDAVYLVAGDGMYREKLTRYVERNLDDEIADRVVVLGYVEDVPSLLRSSDVFVYRSHIDAYPNAILEAKAAGLPVVANPEYGIGEQLEDGETGLVATELDEYRKAVETLLSDESRRCELGRRAREDVRSRNSAAVVGRDLLRETARIAERHERW